MSALSDQLVRIIRVYCNEMSGVDALGTVIRNGVHPWFVGEFADAIRAGAFTIRVWNDLIDVDYDDDDYGVSLRDEDLHEVWKAVAPDKLYPLDETVKKRVDRIIGACRQRSPGIGGLIGGGAS